MEGKRPLQRPKTGFNYCISAIRTKNHALWVITPSWMSFGGILKKNNFLSKPLVVIDKICYIIVIA